MTRTGPTIGDALMAFRRSNRIPADEHLQRSWTCRLGGCTLRLPNFAWRRRAILAHDLHHVLTGYPCTLRGESCVAAWEFGAGGMPHRAASLFCMPLVLWGMATAPSATWLAFRRGRRARSLHALDRLDHIVAAPLRSASTLVAEDFRRNRPASDGLCLGLLLLQAAAVILLPGAALLLVWSAAS